MPRCGYYAADARFSLRYALLFFAATYALPPLLSPATLIFILPLRC